MSAHSQIGIIFSELNYSEIRFCGSCSTLCVVCVQSSGKLEMERGMVKPMIRGEQQDSRSDTHPSPLSPSSCPLPRPPSLSPLRSSGSSFSVFSLYLVLSSHLMVLFCLLRSQDISADRSELTLPAGIEFRDNCEY